MPNMDKNPFSVRLLWYRICAVTFEIQTNCKKEQRDGRNKRVKAEQSLFPRERENKRNERERGEQTKERLHRNREAYCSIFSALLGLLWLASVQYLQWYSISLSLCSFILLYISHAKAKWLHLHFTLHCLLYIPSSFRANKICAAWLAKCPKNRFVSR